MSGPSGSRPGNAGRLGQGLSFPSPDLLALIGPGARLRRAFEDAAEAAADRRACDHVSPLVLARTLLKVAALGPPGQRLDAAVAALHRDGSLSARVRALVAVALVAWLAAGVSSLRTMHGLLESLVHLMS